MPTSIVPGQERAGIFSATQHKRFRPLWAASIMSCVGYMTALTACGWVAFDLHHHSSTVGLVVFASFLPSLIITPVAGVFAAQQIKPQARTLAQDRGIRCVVLDYDALKGVDNSEHRLF